MPAARTRIAREGRPVRCHDLVGQGGPWDRAFSLSTIELEWSEGRVFLHVLTGPESRRVGGQTRRLTPRQLELLKLPAQGVGQTAFAARLGIRETTVRNHVRAVLAELGAHSPTRGRSEGTPSRPARPINFVTQIAPPAREA
jgi:DNA-binding CsgD family transcriptional regulator